MFAFRLNVLNGVARDTLSFNGQLKPLVPLSFPCIRGLVGAFILLGTIEESSVPESSLWSIYVRELRALAK